MAVNGCVACLSTVGAYFLLCVDLVDHLSCVQRSQVLSVLVYQLVNTHARAYDILVVDVLHDHALDLRVFPSNYLNEKFIIQYSRVTYTVQFV